MVAAVAALPDSVLVRILTLLPLKERLRAASSRSLWHLLRRRFQPSMRSLRLRGTLRSALKPRLLSPALLAALGKRCPELHRLCLVETDLRFIPYGSIPASLTVLELSCCEIPSAWFSAALPHLRHLVIRDVPAFSDRHLLNVSSWSRLKTLSVFGAYRLTDAGICQAAPRLEELECLRLCQCGIGDSAAGSIGRYMERLRILEIGEDHALTEAGLNSLGSLRSLEMLSLNLYRTVSPSAVIALCRALPGLRSLQLHGVRFEDGIMDEIQADFPFCSFSEAP
ncbi:F-box/LRR-repeat protein 12 isoform X2 [Cuculus canorus]|uniref:F-box/LRR-repeat protein 12 isoform X2 n=1 Tax=Cuculus canorus TaxID=55661 RepID=UPI0023AB557E|nr:F-box/LRR-repeat protein 12 isoform X2 [Cuculus canorus]